MFNKAIERGLLDKNPVQRIQIYKEDGAIRVFNPDEVGRLLESAHNSKIEWLYPIIIVALNTGMRRSEVLKMKWEGIDYDMQYIQIKEAKSEKLHCHSSKS